MLQLSCVLLALSCLLLGWELIKVKRTVKDLAAWRELITKICQDKLQVTRSDG